MLKMILTELMPWHNDIYDFSLLEVNRYVHSILVIKLSNRNLSDFSRETVIGVILKAESGTNVNVQITTDDLSIQEAVDVECFFSMMQDSIGQNFSTKEVKFGMQKIVTEFSKRVDPQLPFYYHHARYYEGPHPDFDKEPRKKAREKRIPIRKQPSAFAPRRATMPIRGSLSVRPKFHNLPLELPPPVTGPLVLFEHSYAQSAYN